MRPLFFLIIIPIILLSCKSNDSITPLATSNYFNITTTGAKGISATYVTIPIPTKNGTFSLQYNKPAGRIMFWVLGDSNNNSEIDISLPTIPVLNKIYKSNSLLKQNVTFIVFLDNKDMDPKGECTGEVVFTSFTHPGLIKGTIKLVKPTGVVLSTGEFNFTSK
jgi:hypothetical protein